jgi:hypothetical protein
LKLFKSEVVSARHDATRLTRFSALLAKKQFFGQKKEYFPKKQLKRDQWLSLFRKIAMIAKSEEGVSALWKHRSTLKLATVAN